MLGQLGLELTLQRQCRYALAHLMFQLARSHVADPNIDGAPK